MKKQIVIVTLAVAVSWSGGGVILKSYADQAPSTVQPKAAKQQRIESVESIQKVHSKLKSETPVQKATSSLQEKTVEPFGVRVDLKNVPAGENFVPNLVGKKISNDSSEFQVVEQYATSARKLPGDHFRFDTCYILQDGISVRFVQNDLDQETVEQEVEVFKRIYSPDNTIKEINMNGHKGLTVENRVRKVVYVFTDKHNFVIATTSKNGSLEPLLAIAKQIKE